jgi:FlaA1/EpsC-like NDP-sugar epimerase
MGGDLHLLWATALALFGGSTDSVRPEVTRLVSRNMELQELLGRASIDFERSLVREQIAGKAVLITGAGGSIGSELARNVARYEPRTLVLFDISEASLFTIDRELRDNHPELSIVAAVGDVGDRVHVKFILEKHGVDVIYHAAAYKHVPMMESNVAACVINNTLGTERLVSEAEAHAVEHFVFISTDKALRPAGVMGASKRVAERIIQARPASSTRFVIVRFGNVLGSSGSVLPIFRQQIAEGGPVTVTTPDAKRFFMSIPEAVDLVLQAGVKGGDRDIMMLDMGPLVRIADLARRLIERSGLKVGKDIQIVYTGLRAGEKESEELITNVEGIEPTPQQGLWFVRDQGDARRRPVDLGALERYVKDRDEMAIRKELTRLTSEASASVLGDSPAKASSTNFDAPDERIDKPRKAAR